MDSQGSYTAERASALAGVPKSTVYFWAREAIVEPSASRRKPKLWSFSDLLALRAVYWLRQPKDFVERDELGAGVVFARGASANADIPRTSMGAVRAALGQLRELDLDLYVSDGSESDLRPAVLVNRSGVVLLHPPGEPPRHLDGQLAHQDLVDLLAPMRTADGAEGPDLLCPRPELRIVPKKLSGAPHVKATRIETQSLDALRASGYDEEGIARLYPFLSKQAIRESLLLEEQLRRNLGFRAAA